MDERGWDRFAPIVAGGAGGLALVAAVGYYAAWSATHGFIARNPIIGVVLGLVVGLGCVALSERWWRGQRPAAQGIAGAGFGVLNFTLYAGHSWADTLSAPVTLVGLSVVAALGVGLALRRDSELVAILGLVGGLTTPLLVAPDRMIFVAYALLLNVGVTGAALWHRWRVVPMVTVGLTLAYTAWWWMSGPVQGNVATVVGLLGLGLGWTAAAGVRDVPREVAWPYFAGIPFSLAILLMPWSGLASSVLAVVGLGLFIPLAVWTVGRPELELDREPWVIGFLATGPLMAAYLRLVSDDGLNWLVVGALLVLPVLGTWVVAHFTTPREQPGLVQAVLAATVGSAALAVAAESTIYEQEGVLASFGVVVAGLGLLADVEPPFRRTSGSGVMTLLMAVVATVALLVEPSGNKAMIAAGLILVVSWGPLFLWPPSDQGRHWLPVYSVLALGLPVGFTFHDVVGSGFDGAVPLGIALVALMGLGALSRFSGREEARQVGATAFGGVALVGVAVAIPLQLEAQFLTLGWAVLGLAVMGLAFRSRSEGLTAAGVVLLGLVVVRLVFNPAVLSYHLVAGPQPLSWVLYGYTIPVLALVGSARIVWVAPERDSWRAPLRDGLQIAAIAVAFTGINLFVSHWFSGGEALSLMDTALEAQLVRTWSWMGFGVALLWLGAPFKGRLGALVLAVGSAKVLLMDLWALDGLGKALVLLGVAVALFGGALLLQRSASRPAPT
ncbi:MAG: DUF2339 domain-containing protein [Myxococcota bacterium]